MRSQQMFKKQGTRVGAGRPSASGRRYKVCLGTGAEAKKAGLEDVRSSLNHRYLRETVVYLAVNKLVLAYMYLQLTRQQ